MPSDAAALPGGGVEGGERLHPLTLVFAAWTRIRNLALPAAFLLLAGKTPPPWLLALYAVGFVGGPLALALVSYLSFRYRLTESELVIRSGVLGRQLRTIPLQRVQNVDVVQLALHRLLGVARVRVETAGGGTGAEASLSVVSLERANELRERLRGGTAPAPVLTPEAGEQAIPVPEAEAGEPLVRLATGDLLRAGATANEAGIVLAGLAGIAGLFREEAAFDWVAGRVDEVLPNLGPALAERPLLTLAVWIAGGLAALLLVSWTFSIVGAVVRYHGFVLRRAGEHLHKRYGLLTLTQASVPLRRVQSLRVEESVLRRHLGLAALKIETAGGIPGVDLAGGAEAFVPIARVGELPRLAAALFEGFDLGSIQMLRVHPRARRRVFLRWALLTATPAGTGIAVAYSVAAGVAVGAVLLALCWGWAHWQYANQGYAVTPEHVVTRRGALNRVTWIIPHAKLQTLLLRQSPFQRRHGLATLVLDTAAGGATPTIADIPRADAERLLAELASRAARTGRRRRRAPVAEPTMVAVETGE